MSFLNVPSTSLDKCVTELSTLFSSLRIIPSTWLELYPRIPCLFAWPRSHPMRKARNNFSLLFYQSYLSRPRAFPKIGGVIICGEHWVPEQVWKGEKWFQHRKCLNQGKLGWHEVRASNSGDDETQELYWMTCLNLCSKNSIHHYVMSLDSSVQCSFFNFSEIMSH